MIDSERWRALDQAAAERVAGQIAEQVGADQVEVRRHEYAGRPGRIALFDVDGDRFALVPGGAVTVGYDGARFRPTPEQAESFAESADGWDLPGELHEFVDAMTSPPRTVEVPSLLVAVSAVEAGMVPVEITHPRIVELMAGHTVPGGVSPQPRHITWSGEARVTLGVDGTVTGAWLLDVPSYAGEVQRLAEAGRRLPTPDEWEHACGAGAATLFRWGDSCPVESDPSSAEWGPHRLSNAFGLEIGQDPYRAERTADPAVVCGGDGGSMICGGVGSFVSWLTVATAYRDPDFATFLQEDEDYVDEMFVRPVIPLA